MSEVDETAVTRHVESLRSRGVTTIAVPERLLTEIQTTFESIKPAVLAHDQGSCGICCRPCRKGPECHLSADALRFVVGDQSTGESGFNRYVNSSTEDTLDSLSMPFDNFLKPITSSFFSESSDTIFAVNAQFIVGREKLDPILHSDFHTHTAVSLLMPLYEYTEEQASLWYWPYDENTLAYGENADYTKRTTKCVYQYQLGEAVMFSGKLLHQTKPFDFPTGGWGSRGARVLFCMVLVASKRVSKEPTFDQIKRFMQGPAGWCIRCPKTRVWEDPWTEAKQESSTGNEGIAPDRMKARLYDLAHPEAAHKRKLLAKLAKQQQGLIEVAPVIRKMEKADTLDPLSARNFRLMKEQLAALEAEVAALDNQTKSTRAKTKEQILNQTNAATTMNRTNAKPRVYQCQIPAPGVAYRNTACFSDKGVTGPKSPQHVTADLSEIDVETGVTFVRCTTGRGWLPLTDSTSMTICFVDLELANQVTEQELEVDPAEQL